MLGHGLGLPIRRTTPCRRPGHRLPAGPVRREAGGEGRRARPDRPDHPDWTLSAGYAYLDAEIKESFSNCTVADRHRPGRRRTSSARRRHRADPGANTIAIGEQVAFVPKHSASLYTTYDLSDWIDGLSVGGDVVYQSKQHVVYQGRSVSFADRATLTPDRSAVARTASPSTPSHLPTGPYRFASTSTTSPTG
jgi:outer membrane receptor protein involved in Fe transport